MLGFSIQTLLYVILDMYEVVLKCPTTHTSQQPETLDGFLEKKSYNLQMSKEISQDQIDIYAKTV